MNLRKTFFILPNLFTLASVFCGFFAIATIATGGPLGMGNLYQAAIAICFGFFFDLADGRVARLTKTQSSLGLQLDSLADLVTFGVAPSLLMYRWGLDQIERHHLGLVISFLFTAAAALRLARFNVLAMNEAANDKGPSKYILGLSVPAAASILVSLVVLNHQIGGSLVDVGQVALAVVVVALSYLMVSRVRFRSFKDLKLSRRTVTIMGGLAGAAVLAVSFKHVPSAFVFVLLMGAYVGLGLMEEVLFYRRRRAEDAAQRIGGGAMAAIESEGGARSDQEVLEELGAFDEEGAGEESGSTATTQGPGSPSVLKLNDGRS